MKEEKNFGLYAKKYNPKWDSFEEVNIGTCRKDRSMVSLRSPSHLCKAQDTML